MVKNYILDLREVNESIIDDLSFAGYTVDGIDIVKAVETNSRVRSLLLEVTKEYIWHKLVDSYKSIPEIMANLYYDIVFTKMIPGENTMYEAVDKFDAMLTKTDELLTSYIEYMPENTWCMIDVDFTEDLVNIRVGKDLRIVLFENQYGGGRWSGDFIPTPTKETTLGVNAHATFSSKSRRVI